MKISIFLLFLISCSTTSYLSEQAVGHFKLLQNRKNIKALISDEKIDSRLRQKLILVEEVKGFLENDLNLDVKGNYETYKKIDKSWLVKVLTVSKKCSIEPYSWWFPIIGDVPYLGFFEEKSVLKEEEKFKKMGYDTYVRDVDAFSTLGYFSDPIYSTFVDFSDIRLVSIIIHETVHANIFKKGDMFFNESIASFIEELGTILFIRKKYGSESREFSDFQKYQKKFNKYISFMKKSLEELNKFYADTKNCLIERKEMFSVIEEKFRLNFNGEIDVNNAFMVNILLYNVKVDTFREELETKFKGSLVDFIKEYRKLY